MPRKTFDEEQQKRKEADELIEMYGLQTNKAIYLSPSIVAGEADKRGLKLDRQFIFRRYQERGIVYENGLWVKYIKTVE